MEGIVTLEDVLEEIVGEIEDEFDLPDESVERIDENTIRIDGTFPIDDFNEQFGVELPQEDYHTVAGFVFGLLGRGAEPGDEVRLRRRPLPRRRGRGVAHPAAHGDVRAAAAGAGRGGGLAATRCPESRTQDMCLSWAIALSMRLRSGPDVSSVHGRTSRTRDTSLRARCSYSSWSGSNVPSRIRPACELVTGERIDHVRLAGPEADVLDVGSRRPRRGLGVRVEDRELVAFVLEEPRVWIDLELEAVRRLERVAPSDVALRPAVAQDDQAARLVRRLRLRVPRELGADLRRDHHQTLSSIARSTSAASQNAAERYFQPAVGEDADDDAFLELRRRACARRGPRRRPRRRRRGPPSRAGRARRRPTPRSTRAPSGRASTRRGSAARSRRRASAAPSRDRPATAPRPRRRRPASARAGARRRPSACLPCRGRRRRRRLGRERRRSRRRCPRSARAGSPRSRTGTA